jgi:Cu(I)/Ag(I) efflux system membrane protein CusA/SilA
MVGLITLFLVAGGIYVAPFDWEFESFPRNPVAVDAIPDIGENQQIVFTEWPGRSPGDVEAQISYPLTTLHPEHQDDSQRIDVRVLFHLHHLRGLLVL